MRHIAKATGATQVQTVLTSSSICPLRFQKDFVVCRVSIGFRSQVVTESEFMRLTSVHLTVIYNFY
jgi:hypothetical protein